MLLRKYSVYMNSSPDEKFYLRANSLTFELALRSPSVNKRSRAERPGSPSPLFNGFGE